MSSTRSTRRSRRTAKIKEQESSMLGSIGGAIRRAVTPILGNFLQAEEESDDDDDNTDVRSLPSEIDADSFLENTTDEMKRKEGRKRSIKFEEAPSEGDTGAGIGLRLKAEAEENDSSQQAQVKAMDVANLRYKGAYIKNMKVAKIRVALKSLGLPQEGRKDILKEKLVAAVLELHHSDPYANATPAKKKSNRGKGLEIKAEQSTASPKREDLVTGRSRSKHVASKGAKKSKVRKSKKDEIPSTRQSKRLAKEPKVDETKLSSRSTRRSTRRSSETKEEKQLQVIEEKTSTKDVPKAVIAKRKSKRKDAKSADKAGRNQVSKADDTTFTFKMLMRKKKAELIELAVKYGASDKGTKKDLSNNILESILDQNTDKSRKERKVDASEISADASKNNAPVEAEAVNKKSKRPQRKIKTATKNRTSSKRIAKKASGSPRRKRTPQAASKRKRPVDDKSLPTAKRNNAISGQNKRSEDVMDVDESSVSIYDEQNPSIVKEPSFVQIDSDNDPTTNIVVESRGDIKMTDQQVGREYLDLLDDDSDGAVKEDADAEKTTSTCEKISESELQSFLDRLDNEDLKERLKLAMSSQSRDLSAPEAAKERGVAPAVLSIASDGDANTMEEPIKQNRVIQPKPYAASGKEVCQVVKTLMGSHRHSADRMAVNSLEVSDLENEAPSSFVVPFQVPNRNDRLIVHPQASVANRNGPYAPQAGAVYERRPRQSPYGSFTPRYSRRASLGGNFPRSVPRYGMAMSQPGMPRTNRNQQAIAPSHSSSSKRARTIDLAKETQPNGMMQVSDLGGYSMDVRSLKKRRLSSSQYYSRGLGHPPLASPAYSSSYSATPRNIYSSSYARGYARPRTKPRNRQSLPSGVASSQMLTKSTPIGTTDVAKRILDTLEQMSTPLSDARRTFAATSSSRITSSNVQAAHARALSEDDTSNDFSGNVASHDLATSPSRIFGEVGASPDLKLSISKKSTRKNTDNSMVTLFGSGVASEATKADNDRATLPPPSIFSNYKKTSITNVLGTSVAAEKNSSNAGTVSQGAKVDVVQKFVFSPPSMSTIEKSKIRAAVDEAKQAAENTFTFDDPEYDNFDSAYPVDIDDEDDDDALDGVNFKNAATKGKNVSLSAKVKPALSSTTASFPPDNAASSTGETQSISNVFAAFLPKAGEWKCKACSVMNKTDAVKCVSCETPREDAPKSSGGASAKAKTRADGKVSMFTFGSAPTGGLNASNSAKAKGVSFQFGKPPKPSATANASTKEVSFGKPTAASTPSAGGFTFGGGSTKDTATKEKKTDSGTGGFSFGSAANKSANEKTSASSTGFTFGGAKTGNDGKEKSAPSSTGFTFGGGGSTKADGGSKVETQNGKDSVSGASGAASTSTGFTFGAKTEDTKSTTGFTFGSEKKDAGESGKNGDGKSSGGFLFDGAKSDGKPKAATTGFQFGSSDAKPSNTNPTANNGGFTFGGEAATKKKMPSSGFTFGNNASTTGDKDKPKDTETAPSPGLFKFGAATSTDSSTTSSAGLAFGGGGSKLPTPGKDGAKTDGATTSATGAFKFGSSDNAANAGSTSAPSTGFKFGSSAAPAVKKDDANGGGVFNFGGTKSSSKLDTIKERMAKPPKGGDGAVQSNPAATAAFQFGGSSQQSSTPTSNAASTSSGAFQFGTASATNNKTDSSSGNMFSFSGGSQPTTDASKMDKIKARMGTQPSDTKPASGGSFVFGAKSSDATANSNAFGSATTGSSSNTSGMTFGNNSKGSTAFGNSSANASGGFGQGGQAAAKTPAFGGGASTGTPAMTFGAGSNASSGTAFGNSTSNNTFGGQSQKPSPGFGGSGGNNGFGATPSASSMNFGSNTQGSSTFGQGGQNTSTSNAFGGGASAMNFGSTNSGSTGQTFGGAAQNNSTFGGQSQQQATGFGNMAGGGGFGQTSTAAASTFNSTGGFGSQGQQAQQSAFGGGNGGFGAQATPSFGGGAGAFGQAPTPTPSPFGASQGGGGGGGGFNMGKTRKKVKIKRKNRRR